MAAPVQTSGIRGDSGSASGTGAIPIHSSICPEGKRERAAPESKEPVPYFWSLPRGDAVFIAAGGPGKSITHKTPGGAGEGTTKSIRSCRRGSGGRQQPGRMLFHHLW